MPPPRSPRALGSGMVHVIHHRFAKTVKMKPVICFLCEKPMFIGFKCKECKYRCHRDCLDKVPPSCGLPNELVEEFKKSIANNEGRHSPIASYSGQFARSSSFPFSLLFFLSVFGRQHTNKLSLRPSLYSVLFLFPLFGHSLLCTL